MRADVAQNATHLFLRPKPLRPARRRTAVRPQPHHLHHAPDRSLLDELPRAHRTLPVQPFAEIHHVFPAARLHRSARARELFERREGCLVREVILARRHHAAAERPAFARHRSGGYELDLRLVEHLGFAAQLLHAGKGRAEFFHLCRIGIEDVAQLAAGLGEPAALAIDVSVIERDGGERELSFFHDRGRLAHGRIVHSVGFLHGRKRRLVSRKSAHRARKIRVSDALPLSEGVSRCPSHHRHGSHRNTGAKKPAKPCVKLVGGIACGTDGRSSQPTTSFHAHRDPLSRRIRLRQVM